MKVVLFAMLFCALPAMAQERCLDYWQVGESGCTGQPEQAKEAATPSQTALTLDDRIDDFMDGYNKPPREFVAFHLEPTLENALAWVEKYNEMSERNVRLSKAWQQAQEIHGKAAEQGVALPVSITRLPTVPDFRSQVPAPLAPSTPVYRQPRPQAPVVAPEAADGSLNIRRSQPVVAGRVGAIGEEDKIEIRYYFSIQGPYDQELIPHLARAHQELKAVTRLVCVDVTPINPQQENIAGKLDCEWRLPIPGELDLVNIQGTPTLVINRPDNTHDRIVGLIESEELKRRILGR